MSRYDVIEWLLGTLIVTTLVCWAVDRFQKNSAPSFDDDVLNVIALDELVLDRIQAGVMADIAADMKAEERRGRFEIVPELAEVIQLRSHQRGQG